MILLQVELEIEFFTRKLNDIQRTKVHTISVHNEKKMCKLHPPKEDAYFWSVFFIRIQMRTNLLL